MIELAGILVLIVLVGAVYKRNDFKALERRQAVRDALARLEERQRELSLEQ